MAQGLLQMNQAILVKFPEEGVPEEQQPWFACKVAEPKLYDAEIELEDNEIFFVRYSDGAAGRVDYHEEMVTVFDQHKARSLALTDEQIDALEKCLGDDDAMAIQRALEASVSSTAASVKQEAASKKRQRGTDGSAAAAASAAAKKKRKAEAAAGVGATIAAGSKKSAGGGQQFGGSGGVADTRVLVSEDEASTMRLDFEEAIAVHDVRKLRSLLLRATELRVTHSVLKHSQVARSLGALFSPSVEKTPLMSLRPLAQVVMRAWAGDALSKVSQEALRTFWRLRKDSPMEASAYTTVPALDDVEAAASSSAAAASAPAAATATTAAAAPSATQGLSGEALLKERLAAAFRLNDASLDVSTLVDQFISSANTKQRRVALLEQFEKPDHTDLRQKFISKEWNPEYFFTLGREDLETPSEKAAREEAANAKLRAKEESEASMMQVSTLYECKNCKHRKCSWYEQQTRGADEPMTVFVKCLECGHTWTENNY